jgi:hypothetical protein
MKRYQAYITKNWRNIGLANVIVARIDDGGGASAGFFLVDFFCLGVKGAWLLDDMDEGELEEMMETRFPENSMETMHPAWAKKFIEGAVAYAGRLGFEPHRDFRKARRVLGGIDAGACTETFTYGDNGRPHYMQGQRDDEERVRRVLAVLDARCGPDGYQFTSDKDFLDESDISDERLAVTRNALTAVFAKRDERFSVYALTGGLVAMLCRPDKFSFEDALMAYGKFIFDDEDDDDEGRGGVTPDVDVGATPEKALLEFYWYQLEGFLEAEMEGKHPVLVYYPAERDFDLEDVCVVFDWAQGFMGLVKGYEDEWADALANPDLAQCWKTLQCWALPLEPGGILKLLENKDAGAGPGLPKLNDAIVAIYRALHG